jgi:hypothetical protein
MANSIKDIQGAWRDLDIADRVTVCEPAGRAIIVFPHGEPFIDS